jgi:hypothetical protein
MRRALVLVWLVVGCGRSMPSDRPLGLGPTAREDRVLAARAEQRADRKSAEPETDDAEPDDPQAETDAGLADASADAAPDAALEASDGVAPAPSDAAPSVVFEGEYIGEDVVTIKVPGFPATPQRDSKAKTRIERKNATRIVIILIDSSRGTPLCSLEAETQGNRATVSPGQPCFAEAAGGGPVVAEVRDGTAMVDGKRLELDLEIALRVEAGNDTVQGSIDYHFEGDRR